MKLELFLAVLCAVAIASQVECSRRHHSRRGHGSDSSSASTSRSECPAMECPDQHGVCPYGPNKDENHCPLCGCRPSRRCGPRASCSMACPDGFENGPDGCPTCRCYSAPLTPALQVAPSSSGNQTTRYRQQDRPSVGHHARTKFGNETTGETTVVLVSGNSSRGERGWGNRTHHHHHHGGHGSRGNFTCPPMCLMHCEHGFKRDRNFCPMCECNTEPIRRRNSHECSRPQCAMFCDNGYRTDHRGCTVCHCFEPGATGSLVANSASLQCPRLRCHSNKRCVSGFEVDRQTGCQNCVCRPATGA